MPETVITRDRAQQLVTERVLILEPMFGLFFVSSFLDGELLWGKSCLSFRVVLPVMLAKHQEMPAHDKSLAMGNGIQQTHVAGCCNVQRWARRNNKTADSQLACSSAASAGILEKHRVYS